MPCLARLQSARQPLGDVIAVGPGLNLGAGRDPVEGRVVRDLAHEGDLSARRHLGPEYDSGPVRIAARHVVTERSVVGDNLRAFEQGEHRRTGRSNSQRGAA